jgi:hypothetical protein
VQLNKLNKIKWVEYSFAEFDALYLGYYETMLTSVRGPDAGIGADPMTKHLSRQIDLNCPVKLIRISLNMLFAKLPIILSLHISQICPLLNEIQGALYNMWSVLTGENTSKKL